MLDSCSRTVRRVSHARTWRQDAEKLRSDAPKREQDLHKEIIFVTKASSGA